jgi:hypothetical protein
LLDHTLERSGKVDRSLSALTYRLLEQSLRQDVFRSDSRLEESFSKLALRDADKLIDSMRASRLSWALAWSPNSNQ